MKIVNFDGAFFSYEDLEGNIISTPAISGSLSNQNSNTQDQLNGVIPQGNYYLYRDSIIDVKKIFETKFNHLIDQTNFPAIDSFLNSSINYGTKLVFLYPENDEIIKNRYTEKFSIHDGINTGSGGIDLIGQGSNFFNFFEQFNEDIILEVNYKEGYDANNNQLLANKINPDITQIYADQGLNLEDLATLKSFENFLIQNFNERLQFQISKDEFYYFLDSLTFFKSKDLENFDSKYKTNNNAFDYNKINYFNFNLEDEFGNNIELNSIQLFSEDLTIATIKDFIEILLNKEYSGNFDNLLNYLNPSKLTITNLIQDISYLFQVQQDIITKSLELYIKSYFFPIYNLDQSTFSAVNLTLNDGFINENSQWQDNSYQYDVEYNDNLNYSTSLPIEKYFEKYNYNFSFDKNYYKSNSFDYENIFSTPLKILEIKNDNPINYDEIKLNKLIVGDQLTLNFNGYENVDFIVDNNNDNTIKALAGNDVIFINDGNNIIEGGEGNDTYIFKNTINGITKIFDDNGNIFINNKLLAGIAQKEQDTDFYVLDNYKLKKDQNDLLIYQLDSNLGNNSYIHFATIKEFKNESFGICLNNSPIVNIERSEGIKNQSLKIDLTNFITDEDNDIAKIVVATETQNASITFDSINNIIDYTPKTNFFGEDNFSVLIADNKGGFYEKNIEIKINDNANSEDLSDDEFQTTEDKSLKIDILQLLLNDASYKNKAIQKDNIVITKPLFGRINNALENTIEYIPAYNFFGYDEFFYQIKDENQNLSKKAKIKINISSQNDAPIVNSQYLVPSKSIIAGKQSVISLEKKMFIDVDSRNLKYFAKNSDGTELPNWIFFNSENLEFIILENSQNQSSLDIDIIASDGELEAKRSFRLIVTGEIKDNKNINYNAIFSDDFKDQNTLTNIGKIDIVIGSNQNDIISFFKDGIWKIDSKKIYYAINSYSKEKILINNKVKSFDTFDGKSGDADTINLTSDGDAIFLDDFISENATSNGVRLFAIEIINGLDGDDIIDLSSSKFSYGDITLNGNVGDDILWGNDGNDTINGDVGNDNLNGGYGNDILRGGEGNDRILGFNGEDLIEGGEGSDYIDGENGIDTITYENSKNLVKINLTNKTASYGEAEGDTIINIENIIGSQFNDEIIGNDLNNYLTGKSGDDRIEGRSGNDIIEGGLGADIILGGDGFDYFVFNSFEESNLNNADTIQDFTKGDDKIDLSALDFISIININDATDSNDLFYSYENQYTLIFNQDKSFMIKLSGDLILTNNDFIFS